MDKTDMGHEDQDKPQDLSMRTARRVKHIPPPLDLNARTLDQPPGPKVPKSPGDMPRECLPIRKRHLVEAMRNDDITISIKSPKSAGPMDGPLRVAPFAAHAASGPASAVDLSAAGRHTAPSSPLCTLALTPSSASPSLAFTHFPVPPPLIPVPQAANSAAVAAVALAGTKAAAGSSGYPTPPTEPYAWSAFSPMQLSPFPMSSLLSPSASRPSSASSSREDIQGAAVDRSDLLKRRVMAAGQPAGSLGSPLPPGSPMWNYGVPAPTWQCFFTACRVKFLLPNTDAPWQMSDELAWKDHVALKIDARNQYQYAPNGLTYLLHEDVDDPNEPKKVARFTPTQVPDAPAILVEIPAYHPFFVKEKGWCSLSPPSTYKKFAMRCKELAVGDVCLPPNHPEAVQTPDLCDRFKRFEFSEGAASHQQAAAAFFPPAARPQQQPSPPPLSPLRKKEAANKDCDKPKRPMNGFMLFAKKYRLELIQQHPGKDNRAISVLLGEAWKSLPMEERESYSIKAKVLADEQKKIHPDCWKRKKTLSTQNVEPKARPSELVAQKLEPHVV